MAKISFLWIGKTKGYWLREGIAFYLKRISHFVQVEVLEPKDPSKKGSKMALALKNLALPKKAYRVLLDESGQEYTSAQFSKFLNQRLRTPPNHVLFLLGGPYGFDELAKGQADHILSLSRLTFTHDMSRVILLEQVYRALAIARGLPYHHG